MRIVFFGSSDFSVPFLESLAQDIVLVITSEDKRKHRGKKLLPNPVKESAEKLGLEFIATDMLDENVIKEIEKSNPDLFVVVSYGKIIPSEILRLAPCAINVHPSKLPMYRGAAPIERQIMDGVKESAVSIIKVSEKLDRGDIILSKPFNIEPFETKADVEKKIVEIGTVLLREAIEKIKREGCKGKKQTGKGSYAKKITKDDEIINWQKSNTELHNLIRALSPVPGARTYFKGKILKIFKTEPDDEYYDEVPGTIVSVSDDSFSVKCGEGALKVFEVQMEGKKKISARDFINGFRIKKGDMLGG
jgi:methionyl-tRNA formyltransferase